MVTAATEFPRVLGNRFRARLWNAFQAALQSRFIAWTVFTIIYTIPTVHLARIKLLWDDEFFTLYISRASTWPDLLKALATGADQHPPSFYLITRWITAIFGTSHLTVRISAVLGFWLLCICMYEILRDMATPEWAVVAMFFPLSTEFYYYATEARGYGLVAGFAALALLSWLRAAGHRHRRVYVPLLAIALAAAVASHYYAALVAIPLAVGEIIRTRATRKIDFPVWVAFAGACLPILAFLPTIRSAHGYSTHFWATPVLSEMLYFYPSEFGIGACALLGALALAISLDIFRRDRTGVPTPPWALPRWKPWQAGAIYTLAALPLLTMMLAKTVTHGFTPRYSISAIVGVTALLFYYISRIAFRRSTAAIGIVACIVIFSLKIHQSKVGVRDSRSSLRQQTEKLSTLPAAPIVVTSIIIHRLSFYAPRELASRIVYLANPAASISYLGNDTVDRGLLDLRPWFPIDAVPTDLFLKDNPRFYVYGETGAWSWLTFDMAKWGETRLMARGEEDRLLFSVDHVHAPADPVDLQQQRNLQAQMLFKTLPREGPSLCVMYMSRKDCPNLMAGDKDK